jgi:hypothetical protein
MRGGVLSDLAIQSAYPEFQAPNLGLASALEMIVMDKHEFTGIKLPKDIKRKRVSRFPINDIANLASIGGVDNKAKTLYASVKGYRKKLGSSNFDLEDIAQSGANPLRPGAERLSQRMGADYGMNQELKRRGGFVDIIDAKSAISQEQLVSNLARQNINVLKVNQKIRDSGLGLQRVESQLNSSLLSNLENAKVNSIKQNTLIAQDERFRRLSGGEVYYNALTQKDYYSRLGDAKKHNFLIKGEATATMDFIYNINKDTESEAKQNLLALVGAKTAKEYKEITGRDLPNKTISLEEEFVYIKDRPQFNEKPKPVSAERQKELEDLPDDPTMDKNRKPITKKPYNKDEDPNADKPNEMSEKSMKDPAIKDLPKDIEGNIDLTEYIRKREQDKMSEKGYAKQNEKLLKTIEELKPGQKPSQRYLTTPTQFYEDYGKPHHKRDSTKVTPTEELGRTIRMARKELRESYGDEFGNEFNQQGRAEQLFEHFEQATQLNIPIHGIDPYQN